MDRPPYSSMRKKKTSTPSFLFAPLNSWLGLCGRAALDPELTHCLSVRSESALSSFPVSVQDQPGHIHFLSSVQPRPRSRPLDKLRASQSTLCSLLFAMTPSWESYRSLEPAIKSVNGSNTQIQCIHSQTNSSVHTLVCTHMHAQYM